MNKSQEIKNLLTALMNAQDEIGVAFFDATNPYFKSKYASLGSVIDTIKPVLKKNGLSFSQLVINEENNIGITTILGHSSGEWISSDSCLPIPESKNPAQEAGKIITYLRRYALASMFGIYSEEDTDGNSHEQTSSKKPQQQPTGKKPQQQQKTYKVTYNPDAVKAVMKAGDYTVSNHVMAILQKSNLQADVPADIAVQWHNVYRGQRSQMIEVDKAAAIANKYISDLMNGVQL